MSKLIKLNFILVPFYFVMFPIQIYIEEYTNAVLSGLVVAVGSYVIVIAIKFRRKWGNWP